MHNYKCYMRMGFGILFILVGVCWFVQDVRAEDTWTPVDKYWVYQPEFAGETASSYLYVKAEVKYYIVCINQFGQRQAFKATMDEWYECTTTSYMYHQGGMR